MSGGPKPPISPWIVGSQATSSLLGPVILGIILDLQFAWSPWATMIGVAVGFIGCTTLLLRVAKRGGNSGA